MIVLADVGTAARGMSFLFAFLAPFALGLGLGLLASIFVLARKPTLRVGLWLQTGIFQLALTIFYFLVGGAIFKSCTASTTEGLFWALGLPGSFILGGIAMLGPALLARREDRRRRPTTHGSSPPPSGD